MKANLTKRQAILALRETGASIATCEAAVANMAKKIDGSRSKVSSRDVQTAIRELSEPPAANVKVRPLSAKHIAQIHAEKITADVVAKLNRRRGIYHRPNDRPSG